MYWHCLKTGPFSRSLCSHMKMYFLRLYFPPDGTFVLFICAFWMIVVIFSTGGRTWPE